MGLLISINSFSQNIKILFDASKAEAAGNADWVIDANSHNLGFSNGPAVVGQGSESNAQQIPLPAQSAITSSTLETYWEGALSYWGIDCVKQGYIVESLPYNGRITFGDVSNTQDLSHYTVFVICEPNILFTSSEKTAILNFVQSGGGLFMISDHDVSDRNNDTWDSPHIWNDLMDNNSVMVNPFGITFDYVDISQTSLNIPVLPNDSILHGPFGNVTKAQWSGGTTMTISPSVNSTVVGIIYKTGSAFGNTNVLCAYAHFGNGKVVSIGDSSPCDDGSGDTNDVLYDGYITDAAGNHQKLLMNATIWLANSNLISGISALDLTKTNFRIFPDPVSNGILNMNISLLESSLVEIKIVDVNGKVKRSIVISNKSQGSYIESIDVSNLSSGIYFCQMITNQSMVNERVLIFN